MTGHFSSGVPEGTAIKNFELVINNHVKKVLAVGFRYSQVRVVSRFFDVMFKSNIIVNVMHGRCITRGGYSLGVFQFLHLHRHT